MSDNDPSPPRRIAVVTGAARGIGAAVAERLAHNGHDIAIFDLERDNCASTVEAVAAAGSRAAAFSVDVGDENEVRNGVSAVAEELGPPTILVNNAGILRDSTLTKMTVEDWDMVLNVNLRSVFLMSREVQPHMRGEGFGRIVNLSSIAALGVFGEANYSAAKAGVQGITKTLAIELGRYGITVNAVAPGFIVTDMTRAVAKRMDQDFEKLVAIMMKDIHVGRPGVPEDIANAVSFFADERSGFVTGQVLYVAGAPRG